MTEGQMLLLADIVLVVHFCLAAYLALGLPIIWVGRLIGWRCVHNPWFRYSHAGTMGIVVLESLTGVLCPLTEWEVVLRQSVDKAISGQGQSFISYWVGNILFHDYAEGVFTTVYIVYFLLILLSFWLIPVRRKWEKPA